MELQSGAGNYWSHCLRKCKDNGFYLKACTISLRALLQGHVTALEFLKFDYKEPNQHAKKYALLCWQSNHCFY